MTLQEQIRADMTAAMKARDEIQVSVLRSLITEFTNELIVLKRKPDDTLSDDEALKVIKRAVKQRKDSAEQFRSGGREDLAQNEESELIVLEKYMPAMLSKEEIEKVARAKKEELGVTDASQIGQFMGAVMKELAGKADGKDVKEVIDQLFATP